MRSERIKALAGIIKLSSVYEDEYSGETSLVDASKKISELDANKLIAEIADDINRGGTSDKNGVFKIEAIGYYLGKLGYTPSQFWNELKQKVDKKYLNDKDADKVLEDEEEGLAQRFYLALSSGKRERAASSTQPQQTGTSTAPVSRTNTQRPVQSKELIREEHRGKTIKDANYTYIIDQGGASLIFVNNKDPQGARKTLDQSYQNWGQVVTNINAIPVVAGGTQATTPVPSATTQPAAATETATTGAAAEPKKEEAKPKATGGFTDEEKKMAIALSAMGARKLVGTRGLDFVREVPRINAIFRFVGSWENMARIILNQNTSLVPSMPADLGKQGVMINKDYVSKNLEWFQNTQATINAVYETAQKSGDRIVKIPGYIIRAEGEQTKISSSNNREYRISQIRKISEKV